MHFSNENEMNSTTANHSTHPTSTSTRSCASSTDSGVIIIDNKTTFSSSNSNNSNTHNNANDNNNIESNTTTSHNHKKDNAEAETKEDTTSRHDEKFNYNTRRQSDNKQTNINIENIINITKQQQQSPDNNRRQSPKWSSSSKNCSPTLSIRSTTISIVSIDENAIDSSVVDSDSDIEADAEGVHSNYVVKKLGQQTTYTPDSPDLPNINKGLKVISQKISPSAGPLAENILNGGLCPPLQAGSGALASPSTPAIGSIALSNSTDVTFGDKHFYEGPVTIQQFLIDSRDKWKPANEEDGQDNPIFKTDETSTDRDPASKVNSPPSQSEQPYNFILHRKAVVITGIIIVLTVLIGILYVAVSNYYNQTVHNSKLLGDGDDPRRNIPINSTIDRDNIGGGNVLRIVARDSWLAQPPSKPPLSLHLPVSRVIVISTKTEDCTTQAACTFRVRYIQTFNIESLQHDDIIYNFLIGGDGNVYEGRGWNHRGAHLKGYNENSISFAYIGTFKQQKPTAKQLNVTKLLLEEGLSFGKLSRNYKIYSAYDLDSTSIATSAQALYESFKDWPHWSGN